MDRWTDRSVQTHIGFCYYFLTGFVTRLVNMRGKITTLHTIRKNIHQVCYSMGTSLLYPLQEFL